MKNLIRTNPKAFLLSMLSTLILFACTNDNIKQDEFYRDLNFNLGWKFTNSDIKNAAQPGFDDSQWRSIDLPHDISVEDLQIQDSIHIGPFFKGIEKGIDVGFLSGGTAWYRKSFQLEPEDIGQQVILNFDGVQSEAIVFVNGKQLAEHKYGYTPFNVNITPYLVEAGNVNVVAVKVTNQEQSSRWYTGFGIYRNVTLSVIDPVHIADWGVAVTTALVDENEAVVKLAIQVENTNQSEETVQVKTEIIAPDKTVLQIIDQELMVKSDGQTNSNFELSIANPVLWNLESPNLYSAKVMLIKNGQKKDEYLVNFGIRTIEFSAEKGFLLNGKPVLLKGACMHHDNGILGAAAFKTAEYRRVAIMKKNGFNAIRTSHNPPSTYFLDACDQLGMLVIDEAFDMWEVAKRKNDYHQYFNKHWEKDLESIILRDRNHPSIIMWSYGNEIPERARQRGIEIATQLVNKIKSLDTTRPTTQAICHFWDNADQNWEEHTPAAFEVMDVAGYNYRWNNYESDHKMFPERVMYGSESFPKEAFENWDLVEKLPYVIGDFVWTGMDYLGESGLGHSVYKNDNKEEWMGLPDWPWFNSNCGDIDILGNKKPASLFRDVVWRESDLEILVHEPIPAGKFEHVSAWGWYNEFPHWNWYGNEGELLTVTVYSRNEKIKLVLNGNEIGIHEVDKSKLSAVFQVPYASGDLIAIGLENGKEVSSKSLKTTGKPYQLVVTAEQENLNGNPDLVYFNVEVQDENNVLVPTAVVPVEFELEGDGILQAVGNGNPIDLKSFQQTKVNTFKGRCQLIVRVNENAKEIQIRAKSTTLEEAIAILKRTN